MEVGSNKELHWRTKDHSDLLEAINQRKTVESTPASKTEKEAGIKLEAQEPGWQEATKETTKETTKEEAIIEADTQRQEPEDYTEGAELSVMSKNEESKSNNEERLSDND